MPSWSGLAVLHGISPGLARHRVPAAGWPVCDNAARLQGNAPYPAAKSAPPALTTPVWRHRGGRGDSGRFDVGTYPYRRTGAHFAGICAPRSHIRIVRPAAPFGWDPGDVAIRVLDIAGLAVDAVGPVDDETRIAPLLHPFVPAGRTVAGRWPRIDVVLGRLLHGHVGDPQVHRLVLLVVGVGQEHRREPVEGELAVRPGVGDRPEV